MEPASEIVLIDRVRVLLDLLGDRLAGRGYSVTRLTDPGEADAAARAMATEPPAAVVVDLELSEEKTNGLDAMIAFDRWCPESPMLLFTQGDHRSENLVAVAWEAIQPAGAVSKSSSAENLLDAIDAVVATGTATVDPALRHLLPPRRSPRRPATSYARLVPHGGHAKIWRVLFELDRPPSYRVLAEHAGLAVNTVRAYRDDLRMELALHGLGNPTLAEMHEFARTVRPLLSPAVEERLAVTSGVGAEDARPACSPGDERREEKGAP